MSYLGDRRSPDAIISNDNVNPFGNGFWRVEFTPAILGMAGNNFEIYHIYLEGPAGSTFRLFIDNRPYSTASRGDANEYDPNHPIFLRGGQSLNFYWNSAALPKPLVYVSLRTPTP